MAIPADVVSRLLQTGTLQKTDFIGATTYTLADGSKVPSATFRIRSLTVNKIEIQNIKAGVTPTAAGDLLLGQSFLSRFKSWSIDNARQATAAQGAYFPHLAANPQGAIQRITNRVKRSGSSAMFAAIRRALTGWTPGAAPHSKAVGNATTDGFALSSPYECRFGANIVWGCRDRQCRSDPPSVPRVSIHSGPRCRIAGRGLLSRSFVWIRCGYAA